MSKHYIFATSRISDIKVHSEEEIAGYFFWCDSERKYLSKAGMANAHKKGDTYVTYRSNSMPMTECTWEKSLRNEWYLKSKPNETNKDNLLSLPVWPIPKS